MHVSEQPPTPDESRSAEYVVDLAAFVPRLALELSSEPGSTWVSVDGSMLSADISGFTALSERLAGKGKAGAEEITELINTCFTALIDAAYSYGGEIIKFGGDAVLVLFRGDGHQMLCANAAQAMQIALHSSPAAKRAQPRHDRRRFRRPVRRVPGGQRLPRTAHHRPGCVEGDPPRRRGRQGRNAGQRRHRRSGPRHRDGSPSCGRHRAPRRPDRTTQPIPPTTEPPPTRIEQFVPRRLSNSSPHSRSWAANTAWSAWALSWWAGSRTSLDELGLVGDGRRRSAG